MQSPIRLILFWLELDDLFDYKKKSTVRLVAGAVNNFDLKDIVLFLCLSVPLWLLGLEVHLPQRHRDPEVAQKKTETCSEKQAVILSAYVNANFT